MSVNQYDNIAAYYNHLMLGGYYDYQAQVKSLAQNLPAGWKIVELGIGTGLLAKRLIELGYDVAGVDHTKAMLDKARSLLGADVVLYEADVKTLDLGRRFDAAVSNGGVWYGVWGRDTYGYCGHLPDERQVRDSIQNVARHVVPGGKLILSIQDRHADKKMQLPNGILYEQRIIDQGRGVFQKQYIFSRGAQRLAYQSLTLAYIDNRLFEEAMRVAGFGEPSVAPGRLHLVFDKNC